MSLLNEQFRICPPFESAANRMLETVETETARSGTIILLFDIRRFNGRDERFFSINNPLHLARNIVISAYIS